jgi:prephenate dehydrogenase
MKITVIGLGLIGGSMAIDLRKAGIATRLTGVEMNPDHAAKALALRLVDEIKPLEDAVRSADLIIVGVPVSTIQKVLPHVLDLVSDTAVVIDMGSTKSLICASVKGHPNRRLFVAAHPVAGTENSGPDAALEGLFRNKVNIICEREQSGQAALQIAERVFDALEMKTTFMEPYAHDKHVAYVSHLSHVSSFLLGQTVLDIERDEKNIFTLAGSGFASTVRLAKSSPDMWAPIFEQNAVFLQQALEEYIAHLKRFHQCLVDRQTTKIYDILKQANEIRRVLSGIELNHEKSSKENEKISIEKS